MLNLNKCFRYNVKSPASCTLALVGSISCKAWRNMGSGLKNIQASSLGSGSWLLCHKGWSSAYVNDTPTSHVYLQHTQERDLFPLLVYQAKASLFTASQNKMNYSVLFRYEGRIAQMSAKIIYWCRNFHIQSMALPVKRIRSLLLFLLILEVVARRVRENVDIKGVNVEHQTYKIKVFADDVVLTLEDLRSSVTKFLCKLMHPSVSSIHRRKSHYQSSGTHSSQGKTLGGWKRTGKGCGLETGCVAWGEVQGPDKKA